MQHEVKKIALIVNELLTMLLFNGAEDVEIKVKKQGQSTEIVVVQHRNNNDDQFVERLRNSLNNMREYEVEGYYWQLIGEDDNGDELNLVGIMVDEACVERKGDDLYIRLLRTCS